MKPLVPLVTRWWTTKLLPNLILFSDVHFLLSLHSVKPLSSPWARGWLCVCVVPQHGDRWAARARGLSACCEVGVKPCGDSGTSLGHAVPALLRWATGGHLLKEVHTQVVAPSAVSFVSWICLY